MRPQFDVLGVVHVVHVLNVFDSVSDVGVLSGFKFEFKFWVELPKQFLVP